MISSFFLIIVLFLVFVKATKNLQLGYAPQIQLSTYDTIMIPVKPFISYSLYNTQNQPLISKISQVTHNKTGQKSPNICNIIRSPIHKPFDIVSQLRHKMQNQSEWESMLQFKSVIYRLEDIKNLQYAIDLEIIQSLNGNKVAAIFEDGTIIYYQLDNNNQLKEIKRNKVYNTGENFTALAYGKIVSNPYVTLFVSSKQIILINPSNYEYKILRGYEQTPFYTGILALEQTSTSINIMIAAGQTGLKYYTADKINGNVQKMCQYKFVLMDHSNKVNVSVIDVLEVTKMVQHQNQSVFLLLDPNYGILKAELNLQFDCESGLEEKIAQRTSMSFKNCRMLKLHGPLVYTSCPHIISYNPATNQKHNNAIFSQFPLQIISNPYHLTIISHNSFQIVEKCSGAIEEGTMNGYKFDHTVALGDSFISINDIEIVQWRIKFAQYFLFCKGDQNFKGKNSFELMVNITCEKDSKKCCQYVSDIILDIYDSSKSLHILQIVGSVFVFILVVVIVSWIVASRRKLNKQYSELVEQMQNSHAGTTQTEQSVVYAQKKQIEPTLEDTVQ